MAHFCLTKNVQAFRLPQEDVLNGLHFLVHPLHGEPLVLAALVAAAARGLPAVGVVVAVLHGRESDDAANVEDAHGHAAPRDESQGSLFVFLVDKMVVARVKI